MPIVSSVSPSHAQTTQTSEQLRKIRELSDKLRKQSLQMGGAVGASAMAALQALWRMLRAIIQFVARIFSGQRNAAAPQDPAAQQDDHDDFGKPAPAASFAPQQPAGPKIDLLGEKSALGDDDIEAEMNIAKSIASQPKASALAQAITYAGLDACEAILLEWVMDPGAISSMHGPARILTAALDGGARALNALEDRTFVAQAARSEVAAQLSAAFSPPILVEDLVSYWRANQAKGLVPVPNIDAVTELIRADDDLKQIIAHRTVIRESLVLGAACAKNAGIDLLSEHEQMLERAVGSDWREKLDGACTEVAEPANVVMRNLMERVAPAKAVPDTPGTHIVKPSLQERLRRASQNYPPDNPLGPEEDKDTGMQNHDRS